MPITTLAKSLYTVIIATLSLCSHAKVPTVLPVQVIHTNVPEPSKVLFPIQPNRVSGQLVNCCGYPVASATVVLRKVGDISNEEARSTTTDNNGYFELCDIPASSKYRLTVNHCAYGVDQYENIEVLEAVHTNLFLTLSCYERILFDYSGTDLNDCEWFDFPEAHSAKVSEGNKTVIIGKLIDFNGLPIDDQIVRIGNEEPRVSNGNFTIVVPISDQEIRVRAEMNSGTTVRTIPKDGKRMLHVVIIVAPVKLRNAYNGDYFTGLYWGERTGWQYFTYEVLLDIGQ